MARTPLAVAAKKVRIPGKKIKQEALDKVLRKNKKQVVEERASENGDTEGKKHRRKSSTYIKYVVANLQKEELEVLPRAAAYDLMKYYLARLNAEDMRISEDALNAGIAYVGSYATMRAKEMVKSLEYANRCTLDTRVIEQNVA